MLAARRCLTARPCSPIPRGTLVRTVIHESMMKSLEMMASISIGSVKVIASHLDIDPKSGTHAKVKELRSIFVKSMMKMGNYKYWFLFEVIN
jgi:hypothetical protein